MKLRELKDVYTDEDRIKVIANLVYEGSISPKIRALTHRILDEAGVYGGMEDMAKPKHQFAELEAVFNWVRDNITYRNDPYGTDAFHTAERILSMGSADCDDMTILLDSMLASIGWRVGARIVSSDANKPFHHIYSIAVFPKAADLKKARLVAMDPTVKYFRVGDQVPFAKKRDFLFL